MLEAGGCPGCDAASLFTAAKPHTAACRARVEEATTGDEIGRARLAETLLRRDKRREPDDPQIVEARDRQSVFFTTVNPMDDDQSMEEILCDLDKPRIAPYKNTWRPHQNTVVLSHEGLRAINEFAEAELTAMVINGKSGGSTGLPLTETQKQKAKVEKEKTSTNHAASVKIGGEKYSNTHAMWAPPCTHWKEKGICSRGIACNFRHDGFKMYENGELVDRCFVCGRSGHPTKECKAPGGGADPKKDEVWKVYKELAAKKKQESNGNKEGAKGEKTKGKGRGKGKDAQEKGGGKSEPQGQPPTASSMIVAAAVDGDGAFPSGAAGLDSWANIYLIHANPADDDEEWNEELRLADGSKTKCLTKIGKKGIPMAIVGVNENKDNIDLMPMGWLNERGCEIEWAEQVSLFRIRDG